MLKFVMRQLSLFKKAKRRGRPKKVGAGVPHVPRPELARRFPVHVTLRMKRGVWNLRTRRCFRAIGTSFYFGNNRFGQRLNHFSVQGNHLHLICEAEGAESLSRGMQGLEIRMAKALNRVMKRKGRVFADRYHSRILRTPTEVRRAVHYVLQNHTKHFGYQGGDEYSSIAHPQLIIEPQTWLLEQAVRRPRAAAPARRAAPGP